MNHELAIQKVWDSPDVVPEVVDALRAIPEDVWDGSDTLTELMDNGASYITGAGCELDEFGQVVSRHVGEMWEAETRPA
ncbi:MAG: hypothetical protein Q8K58_01715 [Acidimicrobiales bacterium]|nr:hypothetical protein [Acidimicrobiales bacterium]